MIFALEVELSVFAALSLASAFAELSVPTPVAVEAAPRFGVALEDLSRFELLSGCVCALLPSTSPAGAVLAFGSLLGRLVLLEAAFDEFPGNALLFWSAGRTAVPLSSVVWLFGVGVALRLSAVPVPVGAVWVWACLSLLRLGGWQWNYLASGGTYRTPAAVHISMRNRASFVRGMTDQKTKY